MIKKLHKLIVYCISCSLIQFIFYFDLKAQGVIVSNDSLRAQKDLIDLVIKLIGRSAGKAKEPGNKKVFFSILPVSGNSSEKRLSLSTINMAFYLGNSGNTNLSNISYYPATNFKSYFQFKIISNLWFSKNTWSMPSKFEISRINQNTYGLGANTSEDSLNIIDYNLLSANIMFNREVLNHFYMGLGYTIDYFYNVTDEWSEPHESAFTAYATGASSSTVSSGVMLNFSFDSRKNSINPLHGFTSHLMIRYNSPILGSTYSWNSIYFDNRKYISFSNTRHKTLAFWGLYWATWGDVPYLNLPGNGLDYTGWTGRGYKRARYRGKQMIYFETEYRFDLTRNGLFGGVLFASAESFTEPDTKSFRYLLPAAGFGGRIKFNKYSDSNITCDVAFGKNSFNWYVGLNEVF